jgi:hypothetical protein
MLELGRVTLRRAARPLFIVAPALLVLVYQIAPLAAGNETFFLRDVLRVHLAMKAGQQAAESSLPLIDPYRGGGQPLLGNPNVVPLYPDNWLYQVAPPLWALNAHFWLHWLLAPICFAALGRAFGLGAAGAGAAGVVYATSGFFLSQLNFYNLVAGVALAPALVAAALGSVGSGRGVRRRGWLVALALAWALLLLAGDPQIAALAALLAAGAVWVQHGARPQGSGLALIALGLGTLLALPQLTELARILPSTFRGSASTSPAWTLQASWDPRLALEWVLPFSRTRLEPGLDGLELFGGQPPLFFSLHPGLLALVLVLLAGAPRGAARCFAWGAMAIGLFFALGSHNPMIRLAAELPGAGLLRFPVKAWLAVATGGALLAGIGTEVLLRGMRTRRAALLLGGAGALCLTLLAMAQLAPHLLGTWLQGLVPGRGAADRATAVAVQARLSMLLVGGLLACLLLVRRRPAPGVATLLTLHTASQLFFLRELVGTDDAWRYATPPPALVSVAPGETLVQGDCNFLFGPPRYHFPDPDPRWPVRTGFEQLCPYAGVLWQRRYEFTLSTEGLHADLSNFVARSLRDASDSERLRVLAAHGTRVLLLSRPLRGRIDALATLRATFPAGVGRLYVYEIPGSADEVQLVEGVRTVKTRRGALRQMAREDFAPRREVVLFAGVGRSPSPAGPTRPGNAVDIIERHAESLRIRVRAERASVLVVQRAHLPLWRAASDGEPTEVVVANASRLGVMVLPGAHEIHLWVDRTPLRWALVGSGLGALGVIGLGLGGRSDATRLGA